MENKKIFAILIMSITILFSLAAMFLDMSSEQISLGIRIFSVGGSLTLSYLLVALYDEQREILERQLEIRQSPRLHVPPESLDWTNDQLTFNIYNDGSSSARQLRLLLVVEVSSIGSISKEFHKTWRGYRSGGPPNDTKKPYLKNDGKNAKFSVDLTEGSIRSVHFKNAKRLLLGIGPEFREQKITVEWFIEYDYGENKINKTSVESRIFNVHDEHSVEENMIEQLSNGQITAVGEDVLKILHNMYKTDSLTLKDTLMFLWRNRRGKS